MIRTKYRMAAVVVSYHPDNVIFRRLLNLLAFQVDKIYVIDNGSNFFDLFISSFNKNRFNEEKILFFQLKENIGLAKALNVGIEMALADGMDFIVFSDQDSQPAENMVDGLLSAYLELEKRGIRVGAIGPLVTDLHTSHTIPFQVNIPGKFFYRHGIPTDDVPHVETLTLITSGTLVPTHVLRDVGGMREDFFIDQVDIEWCHRARAKGYRLFGTSWARLYQRMGENRLSVWFFGWRFENNYKPLRIYYRLRNFVALSKLKYVNRSWLVRSGFYWFKVLSAHLVFGKDRMKTLKMACSGILDGMMGRMGRHPESGLPQVGNSVPDEHL